MDGLFKNTAELIRTFCFVLCVCVFFFLLVQNRFNDIRFFFFCEMPSVYMLRFLLCILCHPSDNIVTSSIARDIFQLLIDLIALFARCVGHFFSFFFNKGTFLASIVFVSGQINFRDQLRLKRKERAISLDQGNSTLGAN